MVKRAEDVCDPEERFFPAKARKPSQWADIATDRSLTPFGSCGSLAVTEKDTEVFFSSAKRYA